jgi:alpha-tubulin suppressor-like RCC1 family protein
MRRWLLALLPAACAFACGDSKKAAPDDTHGTGGTSASAATAGTTNPTGGTPSTAGTGATPNAGTNAGGTTGAQGGTSGSTAATAGTTSDGGATSGGSAGTEAGTPGAGGEGGAPNDDLLRATNIDVGGNHACAVLEDSSVVCWGSDSDGQVGDGSPAGGSRLAPVPVGLTDVAQVSAGLLHTCALIADGTVKCWGRDLDGAIGNGVDNLDDKPSPLDVIDLTDAVTIAAGGFHSCALFRGGSVKCWGGDSEGQLGNGSNAESGRPSPVDVSNLTDAVAIVAGARHTCALIEGGTVKCWGFDLHGQIGTGDDGQVSKQSPVDVPGLDSVIVLGAGTSHTCALRSNGEVLCWGWDAHGQIGDGDDDQADELAPVPVMTSAAATQIAVGEAHSCAVLAGGSVECWGWDRDGQIGDGDDGQADHMSPTGVLDLEDIEAVSAGFGSTCALDRSGKVFCWGLDEDGQIGDGDDGEESELSPVGVLGF